MLCDDHYHEYQHYRDILDSCSGLVFFAVPHLGMQFHQLRDYTAGKASEAMVSDLIVDSDGEPKPYLKHLNNSFQRVMKSRNIEVLAYHETRRTNPSIVTTHTPPIQTG